MVTKIKTKSKTNFKPLDYQKSFLTEVTTTIIKTEAARKIITQHLNNYINCCFNISYQYSVTLVNKPGYVCLV